MSHVLVCARAASGLPVVSGAAVRCCCWIGCSGWSTTGVFGLHRKSDSLSCVFFFQAEDGIRDWSVTGVQTCALPISLAHRPGPVVAPHPVRNRAARAAHRGRVVLAGALRRRVRRRDGPKPSDGGGVRGEIGRASCRERVEGGGGGGRGRKSERRNVVG